LITLILLLFLVVMFAIVRLCWLWGRLITRIGFATLMLVLALSASSYFADGRSQFLGMYKWWFWRWVSVNC